MCMRNILLACVALCFVALAETAGARGVAEIRKQTENSMVAKGSIEITPEGSVSSITFEREEKLPSTIVAFMRDSVMKWRFEPVLVDGVARHARSPINIRVVARSMSGDNYEISIRDASFDRYDPEDRSSVQIVAHKPPRYPMSAVMSGVGGEVFTAVKVGRDGRVVDVETEQVNLYVAAGESQMKQWRSVLAKASEQAIRTWTFRPPVEGSNVDARYWVVIVPISYRVTKDIKRKDPGTDEYGQWRAYIPGPRQIASWRDQKARVSDTLADGGVYMEGAGPKLLTQLSSG